MKHQSIMLVTVCLLSVLVLAFCGFEQHKTRKAVEALAAAQEGQRLVTELLVLGQPTQAITTREVGETPDQLFFNHCELLKHLR